MLGARFPWRRCAWPRANRVCRKPRGTLQHGFTLLELLVALTLMALLVVMLFSGFRFGARVWEGEARHSAQIAQVHLAQEFLRRQLEHAWRNPVPDNSDHEQAIFQGSTEQLRFIAAWPSRASAARLYEHELYLTEEGGRADLILALRLYVPGSRRAENRDDPMHTILLQDVRGVSFRYYGTYGDDGAPVWQDSWRERPDLPALVRLQIGFAAADARNWPGLVVALRLNAEF